MYQTNYVFSKNKTENVTFFNLKNKVFTSVKYCSLLHVCISFCAFQLKYIISDLYIARVFFKLTNIKIYIEVEKFPFFTTTHLNF